MLLIRRWALGLAGLLGVLGTPACDSRSEGRPVEAGGLRVWPIGCATIDRTARCEVRSDGELQLRVEGEGVSGEKIEVLQGGRSLSFGPTPAEQGWIGTVKVTDRTKALTVRATLPGRTTTGTVQLWSRQGVPWLAQAQALYEHNQAVQARQLLEQHKQEWQGALRAEVAGGLDAVDWTRAALLRGNLAWEQGDNKEAEAWFIQAAQRAKQAGLPRDELESALWWDTILMYEREDLGASRRLLEELSEKVEQAWEQGPWLYIHWSEWARRRGRLDEALTWLAQGEQAQRWLGDPEAGITAHLQRAELYRALGRFCEAGAELDSAEALLQDQPKETCRQADFLEIRAGWLLSQREHLLRQPQRWQTVPPPMCVPPKRTKAAPGRVVKRADDAMALLRRAFEVRKTECPQSVPQAMQALLLARAAMLDKPHEAEVPGWFADADKALKHEEIRDQELFVREWLALQGEWALRQGRMEEAARNFRELLQRLSEPAIARDTKPDKAAKEDTDTRANWWAWRAWIGLAQALAQRNQQAALDAYEHARAVLLGNVIVPPWGQGQSSFLGLHEWGAFLLVDLLRQWRPRRREGEALAVARETRLWALREVSRLRWLDQLDPERRKKWEEQIQAYEQKRHEWDQITIRRRSGLGNQQESRLRDELLAQLRVALAVLGSEDAMSSDAWGGPIKDLARQWPPPEPGEVELHCFPLPMDWTCWVTDSASSVSFGLEEDAAGGPPHTGEIALPAAPANPARDVRATEKQHLKALFDAMTRLFARPAIARKLERAKRLKVAVYGELRTIDWPMVPVRGRPLGERLKVVRMLDMPSMTPPTGTRAKDAGGAQRQATGEAPRGDAGTPGRTGMMASQDPPRALVVVDPAQILEPSDWHVGTAQKLGEMLRDGFDRRWRVTLISGPGKPVGGSGLGPSPSRGEILGSELRIQVFEGLAQAQRFIYVGHITTLPSRPLTDTGVPIEDHPDLTKKQKQKVAELRVTDIVTMPRVPEEVALLGCLGGLGLSEVGGLENLGLANAFLLRGSRWVIAAIRNVHSKITGRLAVALMKAGMAEPTSDPWKVLKEAVDTVRAEGNLEAGEEEDLNAFGVFVL